MRTHFLVVGLRSAVALVSIVMAVRVIAADQMTGHHWEEFSRTKAGRDMLLSLMRGYIEGYSVGYTLGQTTGGVKAIDNMNIVSGERKQQAYREESVQLLRVDPRPHATRATTLMN